MQHQLLAGTIFELWLELMLETEKLQRIFLARFYETQSIKSCSFMGKKGEWDASKFSEKLENKLIFAFLLFPRDLCSFNSLRGQRIHQQKSLCLTEHREQVQYPLRGLLAVAVAILRHHSQMVSAEEWEQSSSQIYYNGPWGPGNNKDAKRWCLSPAML